MDNTHPSADSVLVGPEVGLESHLALEDYVHSQEVACRKDLMKACVEAQAVESSHLRDSTAHSVEGTGHSVEDTGHWNEVDVDWETAGSDSATAGWEWSSHAVAVERAKGAHFLNQGDPRRCLAVVCMDGECDQRVPVAVDDIAGCPHRYCAESEEAEGLQKRMRLRNRSEEYDEKVVEPEVCLYPTPPNHLQRAL